MSGGSMDYLYYKVEEAAFSCHTAERRAFKAHLALVAKALHDIEWVDSGDYSPGDEIAAIRACLTPDCIRASAIAALVEAIAEARRVEQEYCK